MNLFRIRDPWCCWCTVEMKWWRVLLGVGFCRDCLQDPGRHEFHGRVGMRER